MKDNLLSCSAVCVVLLIGTLQADILAPLPIYSPPNTYVINREMTLQEWERELFCSSNSGSLTYFLDLAGEPVHLLIGFADPCWSRLVFLEADDIQSGGVFISAIGEFGEGENQFKHPTAVKLAQYVNASYNPPRYIGYYSIYVADRDNHRIEHYEYHFYPILQAPYRANTMAHADLRYPRDIDIDNNSQWLNNNNHILWATSEFDCIVGFNMFYGTYLTTFGESGSGVGQFSQIQAIACGRRAQSHNNNNDTIYVADRGNGRIVMLSWDGSHMSWLKEWKNVFAGYITDLDVDYNGCLWATTDQHKLLKFNSLLEPLGMYGQEGFGIGDLNEPLSICNGGGHDAGNYAGWYNVMITERWSAESGIRYYVPTPEISDFFTQTEQSENGCEVVIAFTLAEYSTLEIEIFDQSGAHVRDLLSPGQTAQADVQLFTWDAKNDAGNDVPQGDYRIRVTSIGFGENEDGERYSIFTEEWVEVCEEADCTFRVGDADANGIFTISDAVYLITYIFGGGPAPRPHPVGSGDADCSDNVNISDAMYLISFVYAGGPPPGNPDDFPPADCTCDDYR